MKVHELKCWPEYFQPIRRGEKTFEVRRTTDRTFEVGDVLRLKEWHLSPAHYTGRELDVDVTYIMSGLPFLEPGTCVMAIRVRP